VEQPLRFEVDLELPEAELRARTEEHIQSMKDFGPHESWHEKHTDRLAKP